MADARSFIAAKSLACKAMAAEEQRAELLKLNGQLAPLQTWLAELRQAQILRASLNSIEIQWKFNSMSPI